MSQRCYFFYEGPNVLLCCQIFWLFWPENVKGSLTRDFGLQVFFINQCPPGPFWPFQIFLKICGDISVSMFISGVNNTRDKRGKCWGMLIFIFRSRQAGIVSTVLSAVSLTPAKNLSTVSLTPVNSFFSAVSLTPAINFSLFGYFSVSDNVTQNHLDWHNKLRFWLSTGIRDMWVV